MRSTKAIPNTNKPACSFIVSVDLQESLKEKRESVNQSVAPHDNPARDGSETEIGMVLVGAKIAILDPTGDQYSHLSGMHRSRVFLGEGLRRADAGQSLASGGFFPFSKEWRRGAGRGRRASRREKTDISQQWTLKVRKPLIDERQCIQRRAENQSILHNKLYCRGPSVIRNSYMPASLLSFGHVRPRLLKNSVHHDVGSLVSGELFARKPDGILSFAYLPSRKSGVDGDEEHGKKLDVVLNILPPIFLFLFGGFIMAYSWWQIRFGEHWRFYMAVFPVGFVCVSISSGWLISAVSAQ